jgi:hypothetical protein
MGFEFWIRFYKQVFGSVLFSYVLRPGTVFFLGYDSNYDKNTFGHFDRNNYNIFLKFSYWWRMWKNGLRRGLRACGRKHAHFPRRGKCVPILLPRSSRKSGNPCPLGRRTGFLPHALRPRKTEL